MRQCPRCASRYDNDWKICRSCGAILDEVADEPAGAVEDEPSCGEAFAHGGANTAGAKSPRWVCSRCGQSVPGHFEICWNCGTSQDGTPDANFENAAECDGPADDHPAPEAIVGVERVRQTCRRCGSAKVIPNAGILDRREHRDGWLRVAVDGDPDALIFKDRLCGRVVAAICGDCGHVELTVEDPQELFEHYLDSRRRESPPPT